MKFIRLKYHLFLLLSVSIVYYSEICNDCRLNAFAAILLQ